MLGVGGPNFWGFLYLQTYSLLDKWPISRQWLRRQEKHTIWPAKCPQNASSLKRRKNLFVTWIVYIEQTPIKYLKYSKNLKFFEIWQIFCLEFEPQIMKYLGHIDNFLPIITAITYQMPRPHRAVFEYLSMENRHKGSYLATQLSLSGQRCYL